MWRYELSYYHVHINTKKTVRDIYELDLSKEDLLRNIVKPFSQGKQFMCGGSPVDPSDVKTIRINKTEQPSSVLIPQIRAERARSSVVVGVSNEYYVTKKGEEVTREFITSPPKKALVSSRMSRILKIISLIALGYGGVVVVGATYCFLFSLSFVEFARSNIPTLIIAGTTLSGILVGVFFRQERKSVAELKG